MGKFVLYLIESGMCLTLFYLVYVLFFRKETYFNFNRVYLMGIMILALVIPMVHVTIAVSEKDDLEDTFEDIGKFRSYYANYFSVEEDDFNDNRYRSYNVATFENEYSLNQQQSVSNTNTAENAVADATQKKAIFSKKKLFKIFILVYLFGVLFFLVRLIVLLVWLAKTIRNNIRQNEKGYKLVLMEKEIPPFSFFNYIFINKNATKLNEFEQVLAHEKVHVGQKHSLDLIMAHVITVFQWFNPLVWLLQKALKTNHEYIADSKVVNQGFELFDYQSLLLSQLVSIQSVELVNNFNLISIKKRIAMMTKNKSRLSAKLKALLVIPMAFVVFFLFADMTVKSPVLSFTNFNAIKISNIDGIWKNDSDSFGKLLLFKGNKLSVLESASEVNVIELDITIKDEKFQINRFGSSAEWIKYKLSGDELKVWWNDNEYSVYKRTNNENSFHAFAPKEASGIELPKANYAKILDKPNLVINIYVLNNRYLVGNRLCEYGNLKTVLSEKFYSFNKLEIPFVTARLVVDENTEMEMVYKLQQVMREIHLLRVAYASLPASGASELQYHYSGLTQMLPPKDAKQTPREEVEDVLFDILPEDDLSQKRKELRTFIENHPDYIMSYQWKNNTKYGEYVAGIDMVFDVMYKLRDEYTLDKNGMNYTDLPKHLQKEARRKFPMRLSQVNIDEE